MADDKRPGWGAFLPRFNIPETFGTALSYEGQLHWFLSNWDEVAEYANNLEQPTVTVGKTEFPDTSNALLPSITNSGTDINAVLDFTYPVIRTRFADPLEWDFDTAYDVLTVVSDGNGNSYTSRQAVPARTELTNSDYWVSTGNYNAQVNQLDQDVIELKEREPKMFATVSDMVACDYLRAGDICRTMGFGAVGDMGGSWYLVSADTTPNGMDVIALENGRCANYVSMRHDVTPAQLGYASGAADASPVIARGLELIGSVDLADMTCVCMSDVNMPTGARLHGGTLDMADGCRVTSGNLTDIHDVTFIVREGCTTDGIVTYSNAWTADGDSALKNSLHDCIFSLSGSAPGATLIKFIAYNATSSPTGRVGTSGLFAGVVRDCNVRGNALYGRFLKYENRGGWITTMAARDCWASRPVVCIETIYEGTNGSYMADLQFTNVSSQYATGVERYAILAYGSYYFDGCLCWDFTTARKQVLCMSTGVRVGLGGQFGLNSKTFGIMVDDEEKPIVCAVSPGLISSIYGTASVQIITDNVQPNEIIPMGASVKGYREPYGERRVNIASNQGQNGFLGDKYTAGAQLAIGKYTAGALGVSYYPSSKATPSFVQWAEDDEGNIVRTMTPICCGQSGPLCTTGNRPAAPQNGACVFDSTLGKPIWYNGSTWVDATGAVV